MFFLTTAIDYTNGAPHIGHAYEKVLADVLARWHRAQGTEVYFLTGVDQHGQKVQQSAEQQQISPQDFVDKITKYFVDLCAALDISNDGWAATTDQRHIACVQELLQRLYDEGQLYKKSYKGFYSIRQEQFLTDKERNDAGEFGEEWGEVIELEEENWYFKLSEQAEWLSGFLAANPAHVTPSNRQSDVVNAVAKAKDADLCISRPKQRLHWGIELPFDPDFVCYVWFDALLNYLSFSGYLSSQTSAKELPSFEQTWPQADAKTHSLHVIGKDILVPPHGVYWPCMLHAAGFQDDQIPPLLVHGWWNIKRGEQSEKMSKSLGNVVDPFQLIEQFGLDAVRYYLARDMVTGKDSDFDLERLTVLFNSELANDFGNLANRTLNMLKRFCQSTINWESGDDSLCEKLRQSLQTTVQSYDTAMQEYRLSDALVLLNEQVKHANRFIEEKAPWSLAKITDEPEKTAELARTLSHLAELLVHLAARYEPFLPQACAKLAAQLRIEKLPCIQTSSYQWGFLAQEHECGKPKPIFPRIQQESEEKTAD